MFAGFGVLRLSGIDQPQEFLYLEALGHGTHQILQLSGSFREFTYVVLRHRRLKLAVWIFPFVLGRSYGQQASQQDNRPHRPGVRTHNLRMVALCPARRESQSKTQNNSGRTQSEAPSPLSLNSDLVVQLQSELDLPRIVRSIARGANLSKVGV